VQVQSGPVSNGGGVDIVAATTSLTSGRSIIELGLIIVAVTSFRVGRRRRRYPVTNGWDKTNQESMEYQGRTTDDFSASRAKPKKDVSFGFFAVGLLLIAAGLVEWIIT
jgi:hypothetical protein